MREIRVVLSCAVCRKVQRDGWDDTRTAEWCTMVDLLAHHQAAPDEIILSEGYCPDCTVSYDRLMQYGQENY